MTRPRPRSVPSRCLRQRRVSLSETLDRLLNKGAVITGDLIISVADVELVYVGVGLIVSSVETMRAWDAAAASDPVKGAASGNAQVATGTCE